MKHFLFAVLLIASIPASAQLQDEIVVTATALPEEVEDTPAAVTVITRDEIEARAARDVADVLREVPGLTVARAGSSGHQTSLFTRGSNSAHTLVLWNGIEINNPFFGGYDWGQFSTAGVEQVEVVRGPYSALYGSDAVAGVVNILTIPAKSGVRAALEAGGNGLRNAKVEATRVTTATTLSASFESRADDGFASNDDFDEESANVALRWRAANGLSFGLTGRWMSYDLGIPTNLNSTLDALVASPRRRQDGEERQLALPIEQTLGRFSYDLTFAQTRREDTLADPDEPFGLLFQTTDATTRRARLTTRTKTAIGTIVAGGEYERTTVDDVTNFGPNFPDKRRSERSLFVEDRFSRELRPGTRIEIAAGVRHDRYETFGSETSPRVAAAWIRGGHKFRAAYGQAFRAPSVGEMFSPFGGNPDLRAERSRSIEVGYDRSFGEGSASLTFFRDSYRDLITNAGFVFANVGRARSRGAELSVQSPIASGLLGGITYTYLDTEQLGSGLELLRRPRHSGSAFLAWRDGAMDASLVLLRTGAREDILPVLPFSRITNGSHTTLDATVQYRLARFTPYVKIENLTNAEYEEVRGYPSPRRRAVLGIRFAM